MTHTFRSTRLLVLGLLLALVSLVAIPQPAPAQAPATPAAQAAEVAAVKKAALDYVTHARKAHHGAEARLEAAPPAVRGDSAAARIIVREPTTRAGQATTRLTRYTIPLRRGAGGAWSVHGPVKVEILH